MKTDEVKRNGVATRVAGDVAILDILGDLTAQTREEVEAAYQHATESGAKKLLLTFAKDAYINSGGIAIIINVAIAGRKHGQKIRIVEPSEHFQKIFAMVGLKQYVEIYASESEALSGF
ncbi:MAG TPA: STAS domain-containing protein [Candidatus Latescibacteria bacterium]|nr:STAS domain-containing protein [Candidatus Latescibacterota bacterium]